MLNGLSQSEIARVHDVISLTSVTRRFCVDGRDVGLGPFSLTLKLEFIQHGGSFKARGAFTNLLTRPIPPSGVVAASGGNHGIAVAYAAMRSAFQRRSSCRRCSPVKVRVFATWRRCRDYRRTYADALEASGRYVAESQALPIHAFDQAETLLGQGTLARELAGQVPDEATVFVAVGGGGLIGGVAAWYAGTEAPHHGKTRVIGVEPVAAPTLTEALKAAGRSMHQRAVSPQTRSRRAALAN